MKVHPRNENFVSYPNVANFSAGVQNKTRSTFKDGRFGSCRQPASTPKSSLGDNLNITVCTGKKCQENGATQIYEKCKVMLPPNCTRRTSNGKCITSKCSKGVCVVVQSMVEYGYVSDTDCKRYGTKLYNIPTDIASDIA